MSYFPVPVVHPKLYTRHVLELWEYKWNATNEDFDRVCYQPIQIMEPSNNPAPNVNGLNRYPSHPIRLNLEDMSQATIERLAPERVVRRPGPLPRPPSPVFGRRQVNDSVDIEDVIVLDDLLPFSAAKHQIHVLDSPASPDPHHPALLSIHHQRRDVHLPRLCRRLRSCVRARDMWECRTTSFSVLNVLYLHLQR